MEMRIEVVITDDVSDGKPGKQEYRVNVRTDLPESGKKLIDGVERGILQLERETFRSSFATCMEAMSKKRAQAACSRVGGVVVAHPVEYRVDGELGRVAIRTYDVTDGTDTLWSDSKDFLPTLGPREYYRTEGMNDLMLNTAAKCRMIVLSPC